MQNKQRISDNLPTLKLILMTEVEYYITLLFTNIMIIISSQITCRGVCGSTMIATWFDECLEDNDAEELQGKNSSKASLLLQCWEIISHGFSTDILRYLNVLSKITSLSVSFSAWSEKFLNGNSTISGRCQTSYYVN